MAMSSAYNRRPIFSSPIGIPTFSCEISDAKSLINKENKVRDRLSPWRTPFEQRNQLVRRSFTHTHENVSS